MLGILSDEQISIVPLSSSMRSWLGEAWLFVKTVNLILDSWFVLKCSSLGKVPKRTIS